MMNIFEEHKKELGKIENLIEKLPYKSVKINVEMRDGTLLTLEKEKQNQIGFTVK